MMLYPGPGIPAEASAATRWCKYGKHYFAGHRSARCCDAEACRDKRKEAQRESNRKCRAERIARGCAN